MALYAGDRSPKAVTFTISTGTLNGTTVTSVRVMVRPPNSGTSSEWTTSGLLTAVSSVSCSHTLAADGSDLPSPGVYQGRAYMYGAGSALLGDTEPFTFEVEDPAISWPT